MEQSVNSKLTNQKYNGNIFSTSLIGRTRLFIINDLGLKVI